MKVIIIDSRFWRWLFHRRFDVSPRHFWSLASTRRRMVRTNEVLHLFFLFNTLSLWVFPLAPWWVDGLGHTQVSHLSTTSLNLRHRFSYRRFVKNLLASSTLDNRPLDLFAFQSIIDPKVLVVHVFRLLSTLTFTRRPDTFVSLGSFAIRYDSSLFSTSLHFAVLVESQYLV